MSLKNASLALIAAVALGSGVAHAQRLMVASSTGSPGQVVSVALKTDASVSNVAGMEFTLQFDRSVPAGAPAIAISNMDDLAVGSFMPGSLLSAHQPSLTSVTVALVSTRNRSGAGTVVTIPFSVPANDPDGTTYTLHLTGVQANDINARSVSIQGEDGVLTIKAASQPTSGGDNGTTTGGSTTTGSTTTGGGTGTTAGAMVSVSQATGAAGGTAIVAIAASAALQNVASMLVALQYDTALSATADDVEIGGVIKGLSSTNDKTPGKLVIGIVGSKAFNGPGVVARVTFHISKDAKTGTVYPIKVGDLQLANGDAKSVQGTSSNGQVAITGPAPVVKIDGGLVSVSSVQVGKGGIARVTIDANEKIKGVSGATFRLIFGGKTPADAPDLHLVDVASNGKVLPNAATAVDTKVAGEVTVGLVSAKPGDGPGTLATVSFQVDKNATKSTVYTLELQDLTLSVNGQDMTAAMDGGTVTVTGRQKGHLAGDGQGPISLKDATMALQSAIGVLALTPDQLDAADLNGDGVVSISEATQIMLAAVGLVNLDTAGLPG